MTDNQTSLPRSEFYWMMAVTWGIMFNNFRPRAGMLPDGMWGWGDWAMFGLIGFTSLYFSIMGYRSRRSRAAKSAV